jgi:hypothetical protein
MAANKSHSCIAETIINAAVKADGIPPVAGMENIKAAIKSPVRRCP